MPCFADVSLFEPTLPARYGPLLKNIERFMLAVEVARDSGTDSDIAAVRQLHQALMAAARPLLPPGLEITLAEAEAAFFSGGVRAAQYRETVHGEPPLVDTAGSHTLGSFEVDVDERAIAAVHQAFVPDRKTREASDQRLAVELKQLRLRQTLMSGLDVLYPLSPEADNRSSIGALFAALYPGHPLRDDEVEVIRTATALFFCIPYKDGGLTTRDGSRIQSFIEGLTNFKPSFSAHFPSFGSLTSCKVPEPLTRALAAQTGVDAAVIQSTVPTMVVILPADKVDQYIVHDAWGHGWQALLFRFEETYQRVAGYDRLPPRDRAFHRDGASLTLQGIIATQIERQLRGAPLQTEDYIAWLQAATAARLYDTLSGLNAEVLADVVEYKYLANHPEDRSLMPSSSFVKELPTKLDLTLLDMPYYYQRALSGFRRFASRPQVQTELVAALVEDGHPRGIAAAVVSELAVHTERWLDAVHGESVLYEPSGDRIRTNTFSRVALNYLGMHVLFNDLYARLMQARGDVRFADLLVFSSAAYLEEDWGARFWHLDAFLVHFEDLFRRYEAAL